MIRPPLEVADIVRSYGTAFVERHRRWLTALHLKVLRAIAACRTAALGGHVEQCDSCGQRAISYNSCLNRHCPKCQAAARQTWLAKRSAELLPVPYYHVVFTLPHLLAPLALQNKTLIYGMLFRARRPNPAPDCRRSQTPRRRNRVPRRSAHLGSDSASSSSCALRGSRRRALTGSSSMDFLRRQILFARQSAQSGLPGKDLG